MTISRYSYAVLLSLLLLLSGCASSSSTSQIAEGENAPIEDTPTKVPTSQNKPGPPVLSKVSIEQKNQQALEDLNQQIEIASAKAGMTIDNSIKREGYKIGPDDVIEISVFLVEELNKTVRVTGDGYLLLPLLGAIRVEGLTTPEVQKILTKQLGDTYLQNPQVTVFVSEYRSQQIAVLGAVRKPEIYSVQRPRSVLEMLSMAGGLTDEAGNKIRVQRNVVDEETGEPGVLSLIIELRSLVEGIDPKLEFKLAAGDSIMVPKAGTVFIEGSVVKPGAYPLTGGTNVLKALSMSGGIKFQADRDKIQIFRQLADGEGEVYSVSLDEIRQNQMGDIELEDGDVIVVGDNGLKKGMAYFWEGFNSVFRIGTTL